MTAGIQSLVIPVRDAAAATAFHRTLLGADPHTESPYYVGFTVNGLEIGLDPNGHAAGLTGPTPFFGVDDVAKAVAAAVEAGGTVVSEPNQVAENTTVATVADAEGNRIGLIQG
ncbi:VOC family protein [Actinokineospora pegani]|uniref:VOC family protein n=1 Tax=Actinokineospora pegani TaxID=2654637 RepID=UPI0012EA22AD|nr:VOC family protein [Actinokineospora pegani]